MEIDDVPYSAKRGVIPIPNMDRSTAIIGQSKLRLYFRHYTRHWRKAGLRM
jgi:hypothetical protein